jgi:peptide/nickel transport system permease protein
VILLGESHVREDVWKRYFPVILKPIILTFLFFFLIVSIYSALSVVSEVWFMDPNLPPEMRAEEIARASSLESFLVNVLQGNFGYSHLSRRPVREMLAGMFPTTLLLVGLSTVFSVLIGIGLSMLFKPDERKPLTFAHSLKGFFFGLVPFIAIPLMLFFCYYLPIYFDIKLFPLGGLISVPPIADPPAYIVDMLWHLFLPVTTLTLIGVIRILLVIWSSGSAFTKSTLLKKILLPCTTFDFTVMVSAVIIVEYFWSLPGWGRFLLSSLNSGDYNAVVGSFVMILAVAVGFGFVSILLDFIQRLTSSHLDLEKKEVAVESEINPTQTEGIVKNCLRLFLRKRRLMIGSAIVIAFLVLAVFAPFITPYDPIKDTRLAQGYAMPEWITIFPENADLPRTLREAIYWNFTENPDSIPVQWGERTMINYSGGEIETAHIWLLCNFSYPHKAPPQAFLIDFAWSAENVKDLMYSVNLDMVRLNGSLQPLWWIDSNEEGSDNVFINSEGIEIYLRLGLDPIFDNLAERIFTGKGEYGLLLDIAFIPTSEDATCEFVIEAGELRILGLVHGLLGTDNAGRDIFAQLVYGARTAVILVFPVAFLAAILGFPLGFLAGYFQSWVDNIITPVVDTVLYLPILPILLVNVFLFGMSWLVLLPIPILFLSALTTKAFRNSFLVRPSNQKFKGKTQKEQGLNLLKDLSANFCLTAVSLIFLLWTIDFIGFGDPATLTWGRMLNHAFSYGAFTHMAWWWILPPVVCTVLFALGLLLVGTGLEDEKLLRW